MSVNDAPISGSSTVNTYREQKQNEQAINGALNGESIITNQIGIHAVLDKTKIKGNFALANVTNISSIFSEFIFKIANFRIKTSF